MTEPPWTLLLVDDDEDVIDISRLVLDELRFEGRGLRILSAGSAAEARAVFAREREIAVALIDVVMETERARQMKPDQKRKVGKSNRPQMMKSGLK